MKALSAALVAALLFAAPSFAGIDDGVLVDLGHAKTATQQPCYTDASYLCNIYNTISVSLSINPSSWSMVVNAGFPPFQTLFRMEDGACLIGPMEFFGPSGESLFKIERGTSYPEGCDKERKQ